MKTRTKLGQHFLIETHVADREIAYANLQPYDVVLEIGPGGGILTTRLAQKAFKVVAIEIDSKLVKRLEAFLPKNVIIIHGDAVKVDFATLPSFTKIVANLPFQISSPITFKLLENAFSKAILIYQKDFAKRMVAQPGSKDYSRLSVNIYYKTQCTILETIPRNCFLPQPKVDACIVELIPKRKPPFLVADEAFFFDVTKHLFIHRRKTIRSVIRKVYGINGENIPYLAKRVEELSPEQIGELSTILRELRTSRLR